MKLEQWLFKKRIEPLIFFIIALFIILIGVISNSGEGFGIKEGILTAICFLVGALFSILAGMGMRSATKVPLEQSNVARTEGMGGALSVAFSVVLQGTFSSWSWDFRFI